ncbi:phage tail assembly chaperone [Sphingomonas oleivorans]|nr:hypothetical protein [Sphingomonas oleivorans]
MAWLNATPKPPEGTKRAEAKDRPPALSRIEQMKRDKITPRMPPNPAPHLITWLVEIGLTEEAGMGRGPISWQSIDAWCNRTSIDLEPWQSRLLRSLSTEYLAESRRAESENCPAPWRAEVTEREKEVEVARLRMVLG